MVDLDTLWELVKDVDGKCDELLEYRAVHAEVHKTIERDMSAFGKTLYGDGKNGQGLTYAVQRLQLNGKAQKTERQFLRTFFFGILRTIAAAAIIGITVWLLSIYRAGGPEAHRPETIDPGPAGAHDRGQ